MYEKLQQKQQKYFNRWTFHQFVVMKRKISDNILSGFVKCRNLEWSCNSQLIQNWELRIFFSISLHFKISSHAFYFVGKKNLPLTFLNHVKFQTDENNNLIWRNKTFIEIYPRVDYDVEYTKLNYSEAKWRKYMKKRNRIYPTEQSFRLWFTMIRRYF